jgi:hypothetical protein
MRLCLRKCSSLRGTNSVDLWIPGLPDAGIGDPGKWTEVVGFEWRGSVSLLRGEKFMRERRRALAVERDRADVKWAESEEEENGEEDNDWNSSSISSCDES